jgi:hypothetical protein
MFKRGNADASLAGRIGGLVRASRFSPDELTGVARQAFRQRFLDAIPADLPEGERLRRAEAARRAHYTKLALRSVQVRRARRRNGGQAK